MVAVTLSQISTTHPPILEPVPDHHALTHIYRSSSISQNLVSEEKLKA